jgi:hypothetical protein
MRAAIAKGVPRVDLDAGKLTVEEEISERKKG